MHRSNWEDKLHCIKILEKGTIQPTQYFKDAQHMKEALDFSPTTDLSMQIIQAMLVFQRLKHTICSTTAM